MEIALLSEASKRIIQDSAEAYNRRDITSLREKLGSVINQPDLYWKTLRNFIHGRCGKQAFNNCVEKCLTSNEAKRLHNEFIQAIIHNAHFSRTPPPGVQLKEFIDTDGDGEQPDNWDLGIFGFDAEEDEEDEDEAPTFTASCLGKIPCFEDLKNRINLLLSQNENYSLMEINTPAISAVKSAVVNMIKVFLRQTCALAMGPPRINVDQCLCLIERNKTFREMVSMSVREKYLALAAEQSLG